MIKTIYHSPVGDLQISFDDGLLTECTWKNSDVSYSFDINDGVDLKILEETICQLDEYFAGKRTEFTIPFRLNCSKFRERVLEEISRVPYGDTSSYAQIAKKIGNQNAVRAVGSACRLNPLVIFIPCHRIIKSSGESGQYAGGTNKKNFLLTLEKKFR